MTSYQIVGFAAGVGILWLTKDLFRSVVQRIFPQGVLGETNTASLATPWYTSTAPPSASDLEDAIEYDHIVIGTGTAGCVLANRSTEDRNVRVLAIEAGFSDVKQIISPGNAKMGHGPDAVVDDRLKVHGAAGLRVVDVSIFPTMLACHPCAPVVMIAEKAADMIKQAAGQS